MKTTREKKSKISSKNCEKKGEFYQKVAKIHKFRQRVAEETQIPSKGLGRNANFIKCLEEMLILSEDYKDIRILSKNQARNANFTKESRKNYNGLFRKQCT